MITRFKETVAWILVLLGLFSLLFERALGRAVLEVSLVVQSSLIVVGLFLLIRFPKRTVFIPPRNIPVSQNHATLPGKLVRERILVQAVIHILLGCCIAYVSIFFYILVFNKEKLMFSDGLIASFLGILFVSWELFHDWREFVLSTIALGKELVFTKDQLTIATSVVEGDKKNELLKSNKPYLDISWADLREVAVTSPFSAKYIASYTLFLRNNEKVSIRRFHFRGVETNFIDLIASFGNATVRVEGMLR